MRELARRLDVSHNLIPQRFGSKERLWYLAVDHGFGTLAADLTALADDPPDDELELLRALVVGFVERNAARPALLRILNQEASSPTERLDYIFTRYIQPVRAMGDAVLRELHRQGRVRTDSAMLLYFLMTHGAGGPLSLPALAERFDEPVDPADAEAVRDYARRVVDLIFDGLATEPPPPGRGGRGDRSAPSKIGQRSSGTAARAHGETPR